MLQTGNSGWTLAPETTDPVKTPTGLLATRAIETKSGWVGQIILDKEIIWESEPLSGEDAQKHVTAEASQRVVQALRQLFA